MQTVKLGQKFDLAIGDSARLAPAGLIVKNKSVMRLRPPKIPDQFLLQLELILGKKQETINRDGEFRFPNDKLKVIWEGHAITVADIDFMARFVTLIIEKV